MRAKTVTTIVCCSALSLILCAWHGLQAQSAPPPVQLASSSTQDSANELSLAVGKTVLVDCAFPIMRVAIGLGDIAVIHPTSPTEVMVEGKTVGETNLIIWDSHGGRQFFNVTVRPSASILHDNLDAIRRELKTELPGDSLRISSENGSVFLRGTVKDLNSSDRAVKIASTGGKVVNLLNVSVPASDPQILLKVRFISLDRSKKSQFGINIFSNGFGNTIGGISTGDLTTTVPSGSTGASVSGGSSPTNISVFYPGLNIGATIQALLTNSGSQVLAEPNLLASNGKQASFLAGGEYPYPTVQGGSGGSGSSVTITFKEYGVRLSFIPTITPRGTIHLQVAPEVSALDFGNAIKVSGFDVPAITTRKVKTEVELADGQSFVIGGLLDNTESETLSKIPFIGDIPYIGKFFQSTQKTRANTELIVIVTPEIVAPIPAGAPLPDLKLPGKFLPPNSGIPMNTPDAKTAANTPAPAPRTIPVEKLMDSLKPEKPLTESGGLTFGSSSGVSNTTAAPEPAAAPAAAPASQ